MKFVVALGSSEGSYAGEDARGPNGYFTGALHRGIKADGHRIPFMQLFEQVATEVKMVTAGLQRPTTVQSVGDSLVVDLVGSRRLSQGTTLEEVATPLNDAFSEQVMVG
jgi:hypothetical protein